MNKREARLPISDSRLPNERERASSIRQSAIGNWKSFLWHSLMLALAAIFLFPFLWMILTSIKTDQEIAEGKLVPNLPRFHSTGSFDIYELQVRTLDAHIHAIPAQWRLEFGNATLMKSP